MSAGAISGEATNKLSLNEDTDIARLHRGQLKVHKVFVNGVIASINSLDDELTALLP